MSQNAELWIYHEFLFQQNSLHQSAHKLIKCHNWGFWFFVHSEAVVSNVSSWVSSSWLRFCTDPPTSCFQTAFVSIVRFMQKSGLYPHPQTSLYLDFWSCHQQLQCHDHPPPCYKKNHLHLDCPPTLGLLLHGSCHRQRPCVSSKTLQCPLSQDSGEGPH